MLAISNSDTLEIKYVPLSSLVPLEGNSKKHATENTIKCILKYGFRDPIAVDMTLNNGKGAIVEGHDRRNALLRLKESNCIPPRGIKLSKDKDWLVPVIFGINADNESEAIAYSIDHNLATVRAAELSIVDELKLFDTDKLIEQLDEVVADMIGIEVDDIIDCMRATDVNYDYDCGNNGDDDLDIDDITVTEEKEPRKRQCPSCGYEW